MLCDRLLEDSAVELFKADKLVADRSDVSEKSSVTPLSRGYRPFLLSRPRDSKADAKGFTSLKLWFIDADRLLPPSNASEGRLLFRSGRPAV